MASHIRTGSTPVDARACTVSSALSAPPRQARRERAAGFTYLSVIILTAIISLVGATTLKLGSVMQRVAAERELLFIGAEFSDALQSYAKATPAGQSEFPQSLEELIRDPRFPNPRRHLRRIYIDPMTGKTEWGIQRMPGAPGILAIHSSSNALAIKTGNFPPRFQSLLGKRRIADWRFTRVDGQFPPSQMLAIPQSPVPNVPGGATVGSSGQPTEPVVHQRENTPPAAPASEAATNGSSTASTRQKLGPLRPDTLHHGQVRASPCNHLRCVASHSTLFMQWNPPGVVE